MRRNTHRSFYIEDYNIRTDEKRFPENIFSILGFDISRGLTGSQMQGFGHILSNNLTEEETELIMAKYRDGKEDKEIAAEQGISPQFVSQKLHDKQIKQLYVIMFPNCYSKSRLIEMQRTMVCIINSAIFKMGLAKTDIMEYTAFIKKSTCKKYKGGISYVS